jgi:hypothetical protein
MKEAVTDKADKHSPIAFWQFTTNWRLMMLQKGEVRLCCGGLCPKQVYSTVGAPTNIANTRSYIIH